jgi:hypothetical protein
MPIRYADGDEPCAIFEGRCVAEDADGFLEWLRRTYDPAADLRSCTDLHTALMQLLLGAKLRITQPPSDTLLAGLLAVHNPKVTS